MCDPSVTLPSIGPCVLGCRVFWGVDASLWPFGSALGTDPINNPPGTDPVNNLPGTDPAHNPPGTDPVNNPPGTDPAHNPPGMDPVNNPPGTDPAHNPPGMDPVNNPPGTDPAHNPPGMDPVNNPPGTDPAHNPPGTDPVNNLAGTDPAQHPATDAPLFPIPRSLFAHARMLRSWMGSREVIVQLLLRAGVEANPGPHSGRARRIAQLERTLSRLREGPQGLPGTDRAAGGAAWWASRPPTVSEEGIDPAKGIDPEAGSYSA